MLSESSELSQLSELIELPEVFSSMEKALLHQALRLGDLLLELRFVSRSSGTSQSSISFHPAFPDEGAGGGTPQPQLGHGLQYGGATCYPSLTSQ